MSVRGYDPDDDGIDWGTVEEQRTAWREEQALERGEQQYQDYLDRAAGDLR